MSLGNNTDWLIRQIKGICDILSYHQTIPDPQVEHLREVRGKMIDQLLWFYTDNSADPNAFEKRREDIMEAMKLKGGDNES